MKPSSAAGPDQDNLRQREEVLLHLARLALGIGLQLQAHYAKLVVGGWVAFFVLGALVVALGAGGNIVDVPDYVAVSCPFSVFITETQPGGA